MSGVTAHILIGTLAALVAAAAVWDMRTRTVPNALNAAIALLAIPYWWVSGFGLWPEMAVQIGIAGALFGVFGIAFAWGAMGGGDVKLIAALGLWLPLTAVVAMLVIMAVAGGVLTLGMLARHKLTKSRRELEIPYAVAIAAGGLWLIGERFFYQFA